jgi:UDP-N-acetylmuramate-alanine ligase
VLPSAGAIADQLASEAKSGDIFLIMSNGSFDGLCDKLLNKFSSRQIPSEANAR